MILYRAINDMDNKNIFDSKIDGIKCTIDCMNLDSKTKIIYDEIHNKEMSVSLDRIIGHVSGKNMSCWISTSSDFNFVVSEYAIPQSGKYNCFPYRKNVIVIKSSNEIGNLMPINRCDRNDSYIGKYIDLSHGKLKKLIDNHIIKALYQNEKSYYYNDLKNFFDGINGKICVNANGFSNFATGAKEYLFYRKIFKNDIVKILNPLEQDLIYLETYGKNINDTNQIVFECLEKYKNINLLDYHFTNEEANIIRLIYSPNTSGQYYCIINLIPYFYSEDNSVSELYEILKNIKRKILSKITGYQNIPLVDDNIYAIDYQHIISGVLPNGKPITKLNKNDIIYQVNRDKQLIKNGCGK